MFPKDHVPLGLCTKTTDRIKQKPQIEVDVYQHQGKMSICSSRCLSVTNLSLGVKENQNSDVFIVDWGVPTWKSSEKTWRWGVKIHHQQWESRRQPCHEIMIKRSCPAPTECVSLGSPRGKQCREELKHLLKQSEWERLLWGREKGAGRWCRKENVLGLLSQEQPWKQLCAGGKARERSHEMLGWLLGWSPLTQALFAASSSQAEQTEPFPGGHPCVALPCPVLWAAGARWAQHSDSIMELSWHSLARVS